MSEEEATGVVTEAAAQESGHSEIPEAKQSNDQDKNWRAMREQMDELKRYSQHLEQEVQRMKAPPPQKEEEIAVAEDDLSTVGLTKKLAKKEAASLLKEFMAKKDAEFAEQLARLKYTDYDAVVSKQNLQQLVQREPELAKMLMSNPDPVGAYKLIKKMGLNAEDAEILKQNQEKPRSAQSVGQTSALSQAHAFAQGLTPEVKKSLWAEMQEAIKAR